MTDPDTSDSKLAEVDAFVRHWMAEQDLIAATPDLDNALDEIGFDSLAIVDLAVAVKQVLGIEVELDELRLGASLRDTLITIVDSPRAS